MDSQYDQEVLKRLIDRVQDWLLYDLFHPEPEPWYSIRRLGV